MRSRVLGGAACVLKNSPSFFPFSSLSGGYQEMSAGLPSKKSGLRSKLATASTALLPQRPNSNMQRLEIVCNLKSCDVASSVYAILEQDTHQA